MIRRYRLALYILLNILISAAVTISLLYVYDRYFREQTSVTIPATPPALISDIEEELDIIGVAGVGSFESETLTIRNNGAQKVNLKGWKLQSPGGQTYIFPDLTLLGGGSVVVHTAPGDDTVVDLYWGLSVPVWEAGQIATLLDAEDNVRAFYRIP